MMQQTAPPAPRELALPGARVARRLPHSDPPRASGLTRRLHSSVRPFRYAIVALHKS